MSDQLKHHKQTERVLAQTTANTDSQHFHLALTNSASGGQQDDDSGGEPPTQPDAAADESDVIPPNQPDEGGDGSDSDIIPPTQPSPMHPTLAPDTHTSTQEPKNTHNLLSRKHAQVLLALEGRPADQVWCLERTPPARKPVSDEPDVPVIALEQITLAFPRTGRQSLPRPMHCGQSKYAS